MNGAIEQMDAAHFQLCAGLLEECGAQGRVPWARAVARCFEMGVGSEPRLVFFKGLLSAGLDPNVAVAQGGNAAHMAAAAGDAKMLALLAKTSLNWNALNAAGESALVLALHAGGSGGKSQELAAIVLRAGGHPDAGRYQRQSALLMGIARGDSQWVDFMIFHGATDLTLSEIHSDGSMSVLDALMEENRRFRGNSKVEELAKKAGPWARAMRERREMANESPADAQAQAPKKASARARSL